MSNSYNLGITSHYIKPMTVFSENQSSRMVAHTDGKVDFISSSLEAVLMPFNFRLLLFITILKLWHFRQEIIWTSKRKKRTILRQYLDVIRTLHMARNATMS